MSKSTLPYFADIADIKPPRGLWDKLPSLERELLAILRANFHVRDGSRQPDGSLGSIQITPRELLDLMAMVYSLGAGLKIVADERAEAEKLGEATR